MFLVHQQQSPETETLNHWVDAQQKCVLPAEEKMPRTVCVRRWYLVPRVLRNVSTVDLSVSVLGQKLSMPLCVAATAMQRMAHPEGETATARGTRGSLSSRSLREFRVNQV